ncbi:hypothetical protein GCM10009712_20680 [Pseudarthrobacter sulfonivorans]|uniref:aminotransferase class III-fold pyridoxal phosphate-dependent enzyme n=1 Tax=Pseudarthrobacter sulfonivorans TaxID=121292 RepID=UPI003372B66A
MSSWWSAIHGYRNPVLDTAARGQLERFSHVMFGGRTHAPAVKLAERLLEMAPSAPGPPALERVFLADSGSVAVEVALLLAVQHQNASGNPQRQRFLSIRGDTFAAMGSVTWWTACTLPKQVRRINPRRAYRCVRLAMDKVYPCRAVGSKPALPAQRRQLRQKHCSDLRDGRGIR